MEERATELVQVQGVPSQQVGSESEYNRPSEVSDANSPGHGGALPCGLPALQWGWSSACSKTRGGDEACAMFMASGMFNDATLFFNTATRGYDRSYDPDVWRLKRRLIEAVMADRPVKIVGMGPSTTLGRGCPGLRWTDALQNLSNFQGSFLRLQVINRAKGASNLNTEWNHVLGSYRDSKDPLDVIVIDYLMTAFDHPRSKTAVRLLQKYLESWKRPPALVFLETITAYDMINMFQDQRPCDYVKDMAKSSKSWRYPAVNSVDEAADGIPTASPIDRRVLRVHPFLGGMTET